jgi:heme/copper-type cytochrome/quinol oxidase subunit 2
MTENTVPLPPAGWFPDPDIPGQHRWWDGEQWHPSQNLTRELGSGFAAMQWSVIGVLALTCVLALGQAALSAVGLAVADRRTAEGFGVIAMIVMLPQVVLMLLAAIAWCLWQRRLAQGTPPTLLHRSPGWHVGSWFIPVVSLWFPLQNMRDLWRLHLGSERYGLLWLWWAGWLFMNVGTNVWAATVDDDGRVSSEGAMNLAGLVVSVLWVVTAVSAIVIVRRLSQAALERETEDLGR